MLFTEKKCICSKMLSAFSFGYEFMGKAFCKFNLAKITACKLCMAEKIDISELILYCILEKSMI